MHQVQPPELPVASSLSSGQSHGPQVQVLRQIIDKLTLADALIEQILVTPTCPGEAADGYRAILEGIRNAAAIVKAELR